VKRRNKDGPWVREEEIEEDSRDTFSPSGRNFSLGKMLVKTYGVSAPERFEPLSAQLQ